MLIAERRAVQEVDEGRDEQESERLELVGLLLEQCGRKK